MTTFYKFREVVRLNDLRNDPALDALLNSYAIFSSRTNFPDPFDSRINLEEPSAQSIHTLLQQPNIASEKKIKMMNWISDGSFTQDGINFLSLLKRNFDKMIDTYPIYCVSSQCKDFLWVNYAGSHKGFCIELNFEEREHLEPVTYQRETPSLKILDFLAHDLGIDTSNSLGIKIKNALLVKREELRLESEYRLIASNAMGRVMEGNKFIKIQYNPRKVKSIIFGARMERNVKEYIIKNLPFTVSFKQVIEIENSMVISDYDGEKH